MMPFIKTKRRTQKQPRHQYFDGSMDSHRSVKARFRSIFSFGSRQSEDSSLVRHGSSKSSRPLQSSAETTVVTSPKTRIFAVHDDLDRDFLGDLPGMIQQNILSAGIGSPERYAVISNRRALRRSQSSPGLTHKISHKLCYAFGDPTVVHRDDMRSRPSLQEITYLPDCKMQAEDGFHLISASPSSYQSRSNSSPAREHHSTLPTSDGLTASLRLMEGPGVSPVRKKTFLVIPSSAESVVRKLSTISETTLPNIPSIVTVEATATAKIFFETHFNAVLSGTRPRSVRRRELEEKLRALDLPPETQRRARKAWLKHETEYLREKRVLLTKTNTTGVITGVFIAGYEVVKVLGKGSFGVVRLVRGKKVASAEYEEKLPSTPCHNFCHFKTAVEDGPSRGCTESNSKGGACTTCKPQKSVASRPRKEVYAMKVIRKSEMVRNKPGRSPSGSSVTFLLPLLAPAGSFLSLQLFKTITTFTSS